MKAEPDQRNLFAAERTLLAAERTQLSWNRTSIALMGFGFLIERSGLALVKDFVSDQSLERMLSFWVGITFLVLGVLAAMFSLFQYRSIISTIRPDQVPMGYSVRFSVFVNWIICILGVALTVLLFINFPDILHARH